MKTAGRCNVMCTRNTKKFMIDFIIVDEDRQPILGAPTCLEEKFIIVPSVN